MGSMYDKTRVHLLKFTLTTPVHWCTIWGFCNFRSDLWLTYHSTHESYLIYPALWKHLVFRLLLLLFRLVRLSKRRIDDWTLSRCFHRISFSSRVCMYARGMRYLLHEVNELDGYNHEFWKSSGYSLKCVLELVTSASQTWQFSCSDLSDLIIFKQKPLYRSDIF